jgi:hypothetical protein
MKSKDTILENWSVCYYGDEYTPPELSVALLQGSVFNHPNPNRHPDGKHVVTSRPIGQRNGKIVTRSGTEYDLGAVDPEFEKQYPNSRERVFKNLPQV